MGNHCGFARSDVAPETNANATCQGDSEVKSSTLWLIVGFAGQIMFSMRFFIQWLYSEKKGKSVIPEAFWYFSLAGGLILFSYAVFRNDPVFILGQAGGSLIYARNLQLIYREKKLAKAGLKGDGHIVE